ncbi:MAG TPA: hypothetical protein VF487_00165 [Chitinophagaceae bacterium]
MKWLLPILLLCALTALASGTQQGDAIQGFSFSISPGEPATSSFPDELKQILLEKKATKFTIGLSKKGKTIEAYFFPGRSAFNALVIGGVHGSELSSVEVTNTLVQQLFKRDSIFYNVIIIPCLFPDNAATAEELKREIGTLKNVGRYSFSGAPDPNRQMPAPGTPLNEVEYLDHAGRKIETENILLLQLINEFKPQRIASVHAIHNKQYSGFFADPRTDELSMALGYETDSLLALSMANHVEILGGSSPGNFIYKKPTTLYYKDPLAVEKGNFQQRNFIGSSTAGQSDGGVSLGTWAATAVKDTTDPTSNRDAIRIITIEFPGNKRPQDYSSYKQQQYCRQQVNRFAAAIHNIFLQDFFIEAVAE